MEDVLEYRYKANSRTMLGGMLFFGAGAAIMGYTAATNDRALILNGIFTFSVEGATIFYWCITALALLFVTAACFALVTGITNPLFVRLTLTELSAPKNGFARQPVIWKLAEITGIELQTAQKQRFISIYSPSGKLSLAESMFPDRETFETLYRSLLSRVNHGGA